MSSDSRLQQNLSGECGCRSAIFILIKLKIFMVYPYLKLLILLNSNGLAIWSGFPDIMHIKKMMADNLPFWPSFCPNLEQFRAHPRYY